MKAKKNVSDMTIEELESLSKHIGDCLDDFMKGDNLYNLFRYSPSFFKEKYFGICNDLFGPITDFDAFTENRLIFVLTKESKFYIEGRCNKAGVSISRKTGKVLKRSFYVYEN